MKYRNRYRAACDNLRHARVAIAKRQQLFDRDTEVVPVAFGVHGSATQPGSALRSPVGCFLPTRAFGVADPGRQLLGGTLRRSGTATSAGIPRIALRRRAHQRFVESAAHM